MGPILTVLTPVVDLLLKIIIAVVITRLVDFPVFSIFVFNFAILLNLSFVLYIFPIEDKWDQTRLIFNSISYLVLNYHLFLFTNYADTAMYPVVASSAIYLIWVNIAINVILTVPNLVYKGHFSLKLLYKRKQYRKEKLLEAQVLKKARTAELKLQRRELLIQ